MAASPTSRMQPADSSSGSGGTSSNCYKNIQHGFNTALHHHHHHHQCNFDATVGDEVTELPSCAYAARSTTHMQHYLSLAGLSLV
jgi:hypothetical protein